MGPRIQFTLELAFDEWEIPSSQVSVFIPAQLITCR